MPSPDPQLVEMFRAVRSDARNDPKPTELAQTFNIEFSFDGAGQTPFVPDTQIWTAGRLSARLIGAELVADQAGTATVDVRVGTMHTWPGTAPLYDTMPSLGGSAAVELSIATWPISSLQPHDVLSATLRSVASPVTTLTLSLIYRRLKWPSANPNLVDNAGDTLILDNGDSLNLRR